MADMQLPKGLHSGFRVSGPVVLLEGARLMQSLTWGRSEGIAAIFLRLLLYQIHYQTLQVPYTSAHVLRLFVTCWRWHILAGIVARTLGTLVADWMVSIASELAVSARRAAQLWSGTLDRGTPKNV